MGSFSTFFGPGRITAAEETTGDLNPTSGLGYTGYRVAYQGGIWSNVVSVQFTLARPSTVVAFGFLRGQVAPNYFMYVRILIDGVVVVQTGKLIGDAPENFVITGVRDVSAGSHTATLQVRPDGTGYVHCAGLAVRALTLG